MDTVRKRVGAVELSHANARILRRSDRRDYRFESKNVIHVVTDIYRGAKCDRETHDLA